MERPQVKVERPTLTIGENLLFTATVIGILIVSAGSCFYQKDYQGGSIYLAIAAILSLVVFRNRKVALISCSSGGILVLGLFGAPFHPSLGAALLLLGSFATFYLTVLWSAKKFPYLSSMHVHALFKGDAVMAQENERLEKAEREYNRLHPSGPWLFRRF